MPLIVLVLYAAACAVCGVMGRNTTAAGSIDRGRGKDVTGAGSGYTSRIITVPDAKLWLFPGRRPGQPLGDDQLGQRLHQRRTPHGGIDGEIGVLR